jgi:hypothetical protein
MMESQQLDVSQRKERYRLANARTLPDGENATACTQPPAGLAYSPQIVLNGSFSPQTVGAGLFAQFELTGNKDNFPMIPFVNFFDICRQDAGLHICTASREEHIIGMPIDAEYGRPNWFLEQFRNPPVVFGVKGTDGDRSDPQQT